MTTFLSRLLGTHQLAEGIRIMSIQTEALVLAVDANSAAVAEVTAAIVALRAAGAPVDNSAEIAAIEAATATIQSNTAALKDAIA